ncbi:MAG: 1-(5-phosphoribosyl)-5-[(5-phosphoribosylamino)methylideneamino] imidazole-4-carboxamide isomerase [Candidatus Nitrosocaldus sp.]|nr:1-(5-phosphoribosyl)-5-[(5-phosphoribosylamino)methylideneamino] imidazole-4-carboxamide isomerase [Candidatus Nitrosocaldus sp.]MCS7141322.1 1-(5-phosphoribosyl)-5-[(5-phosphoribosylamino)methylideneamino] imidazole-4-carboxamide isomerase [Candidatus Nitrosocaldus sp.]MDW8000287.1 1-(5-phosphoribosyl)-5-[(5-phosphoribosylamino)methylideneamino] imidazole-4-carboxamide isomerase [Candidatus Nitrosocaldus sp.]MDW8274946.1 1-(5-phosphoribosyl)-5-[(5-phosphoribosylamino)methylideneamino] imidaz
MMIMAAIDLMDGRVVRLTKGDPEKRTIYSDDPVGVAVTWAEQGADALHVVDIDATLSLASNRSVVERISRSVSIPVQVAGGIRSIDAAVSMLEHAHSVVIGTLAFRDEHALSELLARYGHGRIVIALDHIDGMVRIDGWRDGAGLHVHDALRHFGAVGVRRFLLTDIGRDGTMGGMSSTALGMIRYASEAGFEVIASGGITTLDDVAMARESGASAIILGKALYEGRISIPAAKAMAVAGR